MKFLIVGLGNPGREYEHTRHNIGFDILDEWAAEAGISFTDSRYGWVGKINVRGRTIVVLKPNTYMNLSGMAVRYWLQQEKINPDSLMVITDDLNLGTGKIRMRANGSHGGHNGLRHISEILGHDNYARLRFGVGNDFAKGRQVEWVLGKWPEEELENLTNARKKAIEALKCYCTEGLAAAMNKYNG